MRLVLFHDDVALSWTPFVETRPVGELLFGVTSLRERAARALGVREVVYAGPSHLVGFEEPDAPEVLAEAPTDGDRVFLCSRVVLEPLPKPLRAEAGLTRLAIGGGTVGWLAPAGVSAPKPEALRDLSDPVHGPTLELAGSILGRPWHLMAQNAERVAQDAARFKGHDARPAGAHVIGDNRVILEPGAEVEPGVVLDVRMGPIWLAPGARVEGPARLTGPLYVGADSIVLGGPVGLSSIGPVCKVRGEVTDSVISGWCNKAHDGHLGHAVLGRWVNLGAGTINSDLKNTYSPVRLRVPEGELDTGLLKVGCFLGDHVRTGIGTLLNTGAVVGAASNLFGGAMPPAYVPPFSWGSGTDLVEYELERFLATAEAAMARREVELGPGMRQVLGRAFLVGHSQRKKRTSRR